MCFQIWVSINPCNLGENWVVEKVEKDVRCFHKYKVSA